MAKNIVLLSDGTGNSAAKIFKTNVWRVYQALDLSNASQIAFYDDGVGTSSFKPLALITGAFGWGLKRNIIAIYMFLCINYKRGDQIFGFGFSRGAFTIRVLSKFILTQGLVTNFESQDDLRRKAHTLYRDFRAEQSRPHQCAGERNRARCENKWHLSELWRSIVYRCLRPFAPALSEIKRQPVPQIVFLGLWDTVDAYGMPIEELKTGINRYIWPLALKDFELDSRINKACHALSIDDKRTSFHPLLWDESKKGSDAAANTDEEQLTQVWFAGSHSNVGGGYPDDGLSYVSLLWMIREGEKKGLVICPHATDVFKINIAPFGRLYDSRAGLGAYYRYSPRCIDPLRDKQGAYISHPKVHESVIWRIAVGADRYAPFNLAGNLRVVHGDSTIRKFCECKQAMKLDTNWYRALAGPCVDETLKKEINDKIDELKRPYAPAVQLTWDTVWWRKVASITTFVVTALVLLYPLFKPTISFGSMNAATEYIIPHSFDGIVPLWLPMDIFLAMGPVLKPLAIASIDLLSSTLPSFVDPWLKVYRTDPWGLICGAILVGALLLWGYLLDSSIHDRALAAWNKDARLAQFRCWRRITKHRMLWGVFGAGLAGGYFIWLLHKLWWSWPSGDSELPVIVGTAAVGLLVSSLICASAVTWIISGWRLRHQSEAERRECPGIALRIARAAQSAPILNGVRAFSRAVPATFAIGVVVSTMMLLNAFFASIMSTGGWFCRTGGHVKPVGEKEVISFETNVGCQSTNVYLEPGATYHVEAENLVDNVRTDDGQVAGLWSDWKAGWQTQLAIMLRRYPTVPWYRPIVRVGKVGTEEHVLGRSATLFDVFHTKGIDDNGKPASWEYKVPLIAEIRMDDNPRPNTTHELFVFVNDAVIGFPGVWDIFYRQNTGHGKLIITKTADAPEKGKPSLGAPKPRKPVESEGPGAQASTSPAGAGGG
jgi:uncharacterized protein (DUF2235 family)